MTDNELWWNWDLNGGSFGRDTVYTLPNPSPTSSTGDTLLIQEET